MNILCVQGKGRHLFCGRVWKSLQKFVQKCKERGFLCSKWALGDRALITDFSCPYRQHRPCVYSSVEWPYAEVFQLCSQKCCTSLLEGRVYLVSNLPTENTFTLKHLFFSLNCLREEWYFEIGPSWTFSVWPQRNLELVGTSGYLITLCMEMRYRSLGVPW